MGSLLSTQALVTESFHIMAQAPDALESKMNDTTLDEVDKKFWRSLEKSHEMTFSQIVSITRATDTEANLTVGMFHDPKRMAMKKKEEKQKKSGGGIFGWFSSSNGDVTNDATVNQYKREALVQYTIFPEEDIPIKLRAHWIAECTQNSVAIDRSVGCMVGMAIGDAVGHPLEFVCVSKSRLDLESRPRFDYKEKKYYNEYNRFGLQRGQWTDDASMGLCQADSLILKGQFDGSDIRMRFWNWWQNGYNNAFRKDTDRDKRGSCGLGGNISGSIYNCKWHETPTPRYEVDHDREDSGNGSIMRLGAMPVFYHKDIDKARHFSFESSFTTHPGFIAAECCSFMAFMIVRAIHAPSGELNFVPRENVKGFMEFVTSEYAMILKSEQKEILSKIEALSVKKEVEENAEDQNDGNPKEENEEKEVDQNTLDSKPINNAQSLFKREYDAKDLILRLIASSEPMDGKEACWNWKCKKLPVVETFHKRAGKTHSYNGYPVAGDYWGAYCMDGLAMAMHCVYLSTSMGDAIEKCVNLLGDADSTASVCGQIAGAIYGYQSMVKDKDEQFMVEQMVKWDDYGFAFRGVLLHILGDQDLCKALGAHSD